MIFVQVKALAGPNFVRASDVLAVQYTDRERCTIVLAGGITLPCTEAAAQVVARLEEAAAALAAPPSNERQEGFADGDASK